MGASFEEKVASLCLARRHEKALALCRKKARNLLPRPREEKQEPDPNAFFFLSPDGFKVLGMGVGGFFMLLGVLIASDKYAGSDSGMLVAFFLSLGVGFMAMGWLAARAYVALWGEWGGEGAGVSREDEASVSCPTSSVPSPWALAAYVRRIENDLELERCVSLEALALKEAPVVSETATGGNPDGREQGVAVDGMEREGAGDGLALSGERRERGLLFRPGAIIDGRYRIEEPIYGGMSVVYPATDLLRNEKVALKVLREDSADLGLTARFVREVGVWLELPHHPNIVRALGAGWVGTRPYVVVEWVDGGTLRERIGRGPTPPVEAATIVASTVSPAPETSKTSRAREGMCRTFFRLIRVMPNICSMSGNPRPATTLRRPSERRKMAALS